MPFPPLASNTDFLGDSKLFRKQNTNKSIKIKLPAFQLNMSVLSDHVERKNK